MTERLHFHFSFSCIRGGNGNPLQCSCLENPRDGGAWWAAVYAVAQSWILLKQLSTHTCTHTQSKTCTENLEEYTYTAASKSLQSCPTLCDPIDGSPSGSSVPGILQARTLEWVAISFSSTWKRKVKVKSLSHVCLLATPWSAAYQAPPSVGFSRQEYWSGVPLPSPCIHIDSDKHTSFKRLFIPSSGIIVSIAFHVMEEPCDWYQLFIRIPNSFFRPNWVLNL